MRAVRSVVCAILACAALTPGLSAGDGFFGRTVGSFMFEDPDPPVLTGSLEQFFIIQKGPVAFEFLLMSFEIVQQDEGPDVMTGAFTLLGADPADSLSGTFEGVNFPNEDGVWTGAASWVTTGGAGAFAGLSGEGTVTTALFINDGSGATAFDGIIVPAPCSLAPLTLVFVACRRRR